MEIVTTLVGMMSGYFINITNDHVLHDLISNLKKEGEPVNHDLQKAVNRSFLSALQDIVRECRKELMKNTERKFPLMPRSYSPEHQDDLEWLDRKHTQLALELRQIERWNALGEIFESADEIESLLKPRGKAAEESIRAFEEKLVAQALKGENLPQCYREKVGEGFFQRICDYFASEIKHTQEVNRIFDSKILAQINAAMLDQQKEIRDLKELLRSSQVAEARAKIEVEASVSDVKTPQFQEMLSQLREQGYDPSLKIRSIEAGSLFLTVEGTLRGVERIDSLFRSGRLKEISGIPVRDFRIESPAPSEAKAENIAEELADILINGELSDKMDISGMGTAVVRTTGKRGRYSQTGQDLCN